MSQERTRVHEGHWSFQERENERKERDGHGRLDRIVTGGDPSGTRDRGSQGGSTVI